MRNLVLESKSHVFLRAVAPFGTTALIVYNGLVAQDPAGSAIKRITDSDILWREWNMLVDYLVEDNKNVTAKEYMGIFGNPIKHTLSPVIHDTLSEAFGIDAKYVPYQIPVEKLDAAVKEAAEADAVKPCLRFLCAALVQLHAVGVAVIPLR